MINESDKSSIRMYRVPCRLSSSFYTSYIARLTCVMYASARREADLAIDGNPKVMQEVGADVSTTRWSVD